MPYCGVCGRYGASADFRRSPISTPQHPRWLCKDKIDCENALKKTNKEKA